MQWSPSPMSVPVVHLNSSGEQVTWENRQESAELKYFPSNFEMAMQNNIWTPNNKPDNPVHHFRPHNPCVHCKPREWRCRNHRMANGSPYLSKDPHAFVQFRLHDCFGKGKWQRADVGLWSGGSGVLTQGGPWAHNLPKIGDFPKSYLKTA